MNTSAFPALFVSHGSPMIALQPGATGAFMQRLGQALDRGFGRPRAVLAISAHTTARQSVLLAGAQHQAVYDFGGFPPPLYELRYDAPGAPELAAELAQSLHLPALDHGGLDHGIWTALRYIYPQADVPVLPLALTPQDSPAQLFALGKQLAALRAQGVLVLATGSITHNLRLVMRGPAEDAPELPESAAFRQWFLEHAQARDWNALFDYRHQAPHAALMHPSDEHLLPWYVAAGAGGPAATPLRLHEAVTFASLGMDAYAFGAEAGRLAEELK